MRLAIRRLSPYAQMQRPWLEAWGAWMLSFLPNSSRCRPSFYLSLVLHLCGNWPWARTSQKQSGGRRDHEKGGYAQKGLHTPWYDHGSGWHGPLDNCFLLQTVGELHFHVHQSECKSFWIFLEVWGILGSRVDIPKYRSFILGLLFQDLKKTKTSCFPSRCGSAQLVGPHEAQLTGTFRWVG